MNESRIWVVGAGGIGSAVIGRLAGLEPVLVVDTWPEHVAAISRDGLQVRYADDEVTVHPDATTLDDLLAHPRPAPDLVLLAVKSDATRSVTSALLPMLRADTHVVSLQNGLNEKVIADVVGQRRVIGAVVRIDGALLGPGRASRTKPDGDLLLGAWPTGLTEAARQAGERIGRGVPVTLTENITGELWSKLIRNAALNAVSALTGMGLGTMAANDAARTMSIEIALEGVRVATALGVELDPILLWGAGLLPAVAGVPAAVADAHAGYRRAYTPYPQLKTSMLQDFEKGRGLEVDQINGEIVVHGRGVGVPTPANDRVIRLIDRLVAEPSIQGPQLLEEE